MTSFSTSGNITKRQYLITVGHYGDDTLAS